MSMIKVENLTFSYPSSYDPIFENVSFQIDTDWKLGFVGRNGRGKTTFLNLLMDQYEYRGKIIKSVRFDYFPYLVKDTKKWTMEVLNEVCPQAEECRYGRNFTLWKWMKKCFGVLLRRFPTENRRKSFLQHCF